jgi:hypothetical protein
LRAICATRPESRNPEATKRLAVTLGYQALADRQQPERPGFELAVQFPQELLHATHFDVTASRGVNAGCP